MPTRMPGAGMGAWGKDTVYALSALQCLSRAVVVHALLIK